MFSLRSRRDKWRILTVGAASFLTIFPLCAWRHLDIIESDIYDRVTEAMTLANIVGLDVSVNGRDVNLTGGLPDTEYQRAVGLIEALPGVRKVASTQAVQNEGGEN
ncbi:MAG: hypothetical protein HKN59_01970 [Gammaproteobacteria bacterium]|nr:hypothetical protein [Gammaproteobacteria bacterium]